jgi:cysteine desulfurase
MIYLDHNATTPLCTPARESLHRTLESNLFGNPSSTHAEGRRARAVIDQARDQLAHTLGCRPSELIFTGSGTESNNLAVLGLAKAHRHKGRHIVCSAIEHHAVLAAAEALQTEGYDISFVRPDANGTVQAESVLAALRPDTTLVSLMTANNETGVIQPVEQIASACRQRAILFHTDAVQALGKMPVNLRSFHAVSAAAHKFHGPKGVGFLYLEGGLPLSPCLHGGAQENSRRPGTENAAAIAAMAEAATFSLAKLADGEPERLASLRDHFESALACVWPGCTINGLNASRLPNTSNVRFPGVPSEDMLMCLDLEGVAASSGAACMVGSIQASHVLLAMDQSRAEATEVVRFSLGSDTTLHHIDRTLSALAAIRSRLAP